MAFKERLETITHHGAVSFALLAAKELGIFDALSNAQRPLTSQQLASGKRLKERYVREILGCLTSASLVQISSDSDAEGQGQLSYYLTQEAKAIVKHSVAFVDVGIIGLIASKYAPVKACCHIDGPYGIRYGTDVFRFLDEMGKISDDKIMEQILSRSPGLQAKLEGGIKALELGSGTGRLLSLFARRFPKSTFTASEVDDVTLASIKDGWSNIPNMHFETLDLCHMVEFPSTKFDWILAVNVLHHLPHLLVGLKNAREMIDEDDGWFTFWDTACPEGHGSTKGSDKAAYAYASSAFLCIPESFHTDDSEAYGACWAAGTVVSMLEQARFDVTVETFDDFDLMFVGRCKRQSGLNGALH